MVIALDAVTGLPLDDSYLTQYQIPLGSQPINLEELGALGRQSNWLYPDNLPGVVSRLQARDNTNPLNAQDLSTDGERNLNVNIAKGGGSGGGGIVKQNGSSSSLHVLGYGGSGPYPSTFRAIDLTNNTLLWGFLFSTTAVSTGSNTGVGVFNLQLSKSGTTFDLCTLLYNDSGTVAGITEHQSTTVMFPQPFDLAQMFPGETRVDIHAIFPPVESNLAFTIYIAP